MDAQPTPSIDRRDVVTASDLVRSFGTWGERALHQPVYIFHRGRPQLILASVALIDSLCRPLEDDGDARLTALLDAAPGIILIVDRRLEIVATSRAVRARFGDAATPGSAVATLVEPARADILRQAIGRVLRTSRSETIEVPFAGELGHATTLTIAPHPDGVVMVGCQTSDPANDDRSSLEETFSLASNAAVARLDRYGFLDGPHSALATLTSIGDSMLSSVRFTSLFSVSSRGAVAELIAAVEADGRSRTGEAQLLIADADPRHVTVSFAPRRRGNAVHGIVALILATT